MKTQDLTVIFFREKMFYPIELQNPDKCGKSLKEQAEEQAIGNPGTEKVEMLDGEILWRLQ